jgi:heme exporter protein C
MALYFAFDDARTGAKAAAILSLVGVINLPIIHYSVEWWNTLHQGATITKFERPSIATSMLIPLLICLAGFLFLTISLVMMRLKNEILRHELGRPWAQQELEKN